MKPVLTLYTRPDCTLCELAYQQAAAQGIELEPKDISLNLDWLMRYRDSIPVVENPENGQTVSWPFEPADLLALLESRS